MKMMCFDEPAELEGYLLDVVDAQQDAVPVFREKLDGSTELITTFLGDVFVFLVSDDKDGVKTLIKSLTNNDVPVCRGFCGGDEWSANTVASRYKTEKEAE